MDNQNNLNNEGGTSTFKRVLALILVILLLAAGGFALPIFLGTMQGEQNAEVQNSSVASSCAQHE